VSVSRFQRPADRTVPDLNDPIHYINRELSWLEFNQRVLDQATSEYHPLLERVKFLAIVASNLDEFFMVRVATLLKKQRAGAEDLSVDGLTPSQQLAAVRQRAARLMADQAACWSRSLRPELEKHGIRFIEASDYTDGIRTYLAKYFRHEIFPLLTPLAFDPGHPFPFISNRSRNFAIAVRHQGRTKFARVKVPDKLPRFIPLPGASGTHAFVFLEDVMRLNLGELFPGIELLSAYQFRVIRDSDMEIVEDGADDLLTSVDRSLRQLRHGMPSLLQVEADMPAEVVATLVENFEVEQDVVMRSTERLGFSDWMALHKLPLPVLKDPPFVPRTLWADAHHDQSTFHDIRQQDRFVHHPFDSFTAVETFLKQASTDPQVVAIKMTLYRIGQNSPLVDMLIDAAEAGKQVAVLVELKARFDERNNIKWATRLEAAGVHVVYGVEGLKTHCKLCLVVRREADGIQRYAHIGTGNYNPTTAQTYTDFGLFTADADIIDDVAQVFNLLTGYSRQDNYKQLLVAPVTLRSRLLTLIDREISIARAGIPARIIIKNNAITDPEIVRALYRASDAGVEIDIIVRGVCCLRTGEAGVGERIRVRSVVGRFLEHSRVYCFGNGGRDEVFIGSADLMERNLDRRVEVLCPIRDRAIATHVLTTVLETYLKDNDRATQLVGDRYEPIRRAEGVTHVNAQQELLDWYTSRPHTTGGPTDAA
jgi:polyphosphate kinase